MERDRNLFLGKKLCKLRKHFNLTQKECVEGLGLLRQQDYSDLETGKREFNKTVLEKICALFSISMPEFTSLQNLDTFPYLCEFKTRVISPELLRHKEKLEVLILRKHLLEKEQRILRMEEELCRRGVRPLTEPEAGKINIYVII